MLESQRCSECGIYVEIARYEKVRLCKSCRSEKRVSHNEIRQLYKELKKKNMDLPKDDWSSLNVECKDNQIWKKKWIY
tara:strand:+ start:690 stop:923 length:234 start_codon:yes stop_codon:yes gene_type:complete